MAAADLIFHVLVAAMLNDLRSNKASKPDILRIALVGCGALSETFYAPAISAIAVEEYLSVSCLVDPDTRRTDNLGVFFPSATKLIGIDSLNPNQVDLAIIASPQRYHYDQTVIFLNHGVHVLCEKPLASSVLEVEAMVETANKNGRLLSVGLFRRFFPNTQYVCDLISGQDLGKPCRFSWSEGGVFDWPAATPSFFLREASSGGVFADLGAHILDLLLHWFGSVAEFHYEDDSMGGLEANASLHLRFERGVTGKLRLSRDTQIPNYVWIEFERGTVWFQGGVSGEVTLHLKHSDLVAKSSLYNKPVNRFASRTAHGNHALTYAQCFMEQIRNLCRAIRGEETLRIPATEALGSISLLEQCYASRKLMTMPWLSESEKLAAQALVD